MKPDGATMETPEPGETAAAAEPSSQENITEEVQPQLEGAPEATQKANGKPLAVDPKVKSKAAGSKIQSTTSAGIAGSSSRPGTASHRTQKDVKSSSAGPGGKKAPGTTSKTSAALAVSKRPVGIAAVSTTAKNQTRALDKRPVGPVKTTSLPEATATNGTKPRAPNGAAKKPAAEAGNGARPKTTTATNRPVTSAAPKPNTSTVTKPSGPASSKTRPAAGPSTSRPTSTISKPAAATTKVSTTATAKVASLRAAAAPSAGRTAAAQPNKNTAAKRDVSRPPSAAAAKKTFTATASPAAKKKEASKPTTAVKPNSAQTATKAAEPKVSQGKIQQPAKSTPTRKPAAAARFPVPNRPPLVRTLPSSPAGKPPSAAKPATPIARRGTKPTQTVSPFTKKTSNLALPAAGPQRAAASVTTAVQVAESVTEATAALEESCAVASAVEEVSTHVSAQHERPEVPEEVIQHGEEAHPPSQSPIQTSPPISPFQQQSENCAESPSVQEQVSSPAKPSSPTVASSADLPQEREYLSTDPTPSAPAAQSTEANAIPQTAPPVDLNEEEDEEEREGSQLVSVSEMSGTTQPTEESRPGSGGPVGGAAWKAGGGLLSELDSEDVSGSQQGASELSAPGVLEGTESTDDLGDGSLKGAIDMEGASAGSPDFEKFLDIPVNEFEDDDSDRVCDMEVGSERTDEPRRPRHDNDVDEDEDDDDVEMASEGVTESGLESYGNADEDDFAEDERLDNLNRILQPPPPPPVLPSAPGAQWDQPNPFSYPWAEPPQSDVPQLPEEAVAKALADPLPADSETLIQTPAQAWIEVGSAPSALERLDVPHHSSVPNAPHNVEPQGPTSVSDTDIPAANTVSSERSTPEDHGDQNHEGKLQCPSSQPDGDCQDPDALTERGDDEEEAEPETLPADEVLCGPSTAPTSNPSSSSVTEDEASDTEGEAQLDDSLGCPAVRHLTFDVQSSPLRCLSTVEEGEEAESGAGDEATPLSATSVASYIFDSVTTASNSNAQSSGESCIKSPGIFSLEELSEEAKEPCLNREPNTQQCPAEQPYIECGKQEAEVAEHVEMEQLGSKDASEKPEESREDIQPPYFSAICEKTEDSFAGNV